MKLALVSLLLAVGCSSRKPEPAKTPASTDLKARCERLVAKATKFGLTEAESTVEQKVEHCVKEKPSDAFFECVDKAETEAAAKACN